MTTEPTESTPYARESTSGIDWDFEPGTIENWFTVNMAENGPIENAQVTLWAIAIMVGVMVVLTRKQVRERFFGGWLSFMSMLALLREADLHTVPKPETLGYWGVHIRLRWWLSADAPVLPRIMWAVIFAAMLAAVIVPIVRVAPKHLPLLKARDAAWRLFLFSGVALLLGYTFDDLLGRGLFVHPVYTQVLEESFELIGATLFCLAIVSIYKISLTSREQRAQALLDAQRAGDAHEQKQPA